LQVHSPQPLPGPRIALYSHDTMGLGHIRRNQLIAMALAAPPLNATVLLITGVREGGAFPMPAGIDSVVLPAYRKEADGAYASRSLNIGIDQLVEFRADLIDLALKRFQPELFIADNVPGGALDELLPALERLRREGGTHCVLGLRDILDCPDAVRREWAQRGNFETIRRLYDAVWVYGDPAVFPTAAAYDFPRDVRSMTTYTGYLDPFRASAKRMGLRSLGEDSRQVVLCSVGGGQDGFELARSFAAAAMPPLMRGLIVTGPLMPREAREALLRQIEGRGDIALVDGVCDLVPLLEQADRVVAMAGYNTANEILASGRPALFVPRVAPRSEQLIRARRLEELGLASCLTDAEATPQASGAWLERPAARSTARGFADFGGLDAVVRLACQVTMGRLPVPPARPAMRLVAARQA
jgi:predicted glycosyltransferase